MDGRLLEACAAHDPEAASATLYEHLDLAGHFYAPELGERGLFDR